MIPVVAWYVAVNAAAFGLCAAARSRRTGGALSALVRLMVVAGGAPGMLLSRAIWRRGPREPGPLARAGPRMWLLLHAAVLAALADRAGGWLAVLRRVPGLGLYLACVNAVAFLAFAADKARAALGRFRIRETALLSLALAGGALGAMGRYGLGLIPLGGELPLMTLLINFLGSVAIGAIVETSELAAGALSREAVLFLKVGLCGGFTTFSTFSLETLGLIEGGQYAIAGAYALVSVVLCVAGVLVGKVLARALMPTG